MSRTDLPAGRTACLGGEYEDWSAPSSCICNDVVVFSGDEAPTIYGYP